MTGTRLPAETGAVQVVFTGRVQGVGFRPHLARLAAGLGLAGWTRNETGTVVAVIEGPALRRDAFLRDALETAPPLAAPEIGCLDAIASSGLTGFAIRESASGASADVHIPPDTAPCRHCLREMRDAVDRRYRYPFLNCTQCGPRYTVIEAMPYDRVNTSMAGFRLCEACQAEYADPTDRRFHAEPIACPDCGPQVWYSKLGDTEDIRGDSALLAASETIAAGGIVALRGVGGYQLLCDATNARAVAVLRTRKGRPDKPFAVMVPEAGADGLDFARQISRIDADASDVLRGAARPIVLLPRRHGELLAPNVAPGCAEVGLFLPASPLHHLLLEQLAVPVVATSGNIGGMPILTEVDEAEQYLGAVADGFLHHDRPISRPADDPVLRFVGGAPCPLRMGRGTAPVELDLAAALPRPVLAAGAQGKVAVSLAFGARVVISPHLGDMASPRALERFRSLASELQRLHGACAETILCDAHPGMATHRWARRTGLPVVPILHHHAHASALVGEAELGPGDWLIFAWDALGLGEAGEFWGGETFSGRPGGWHRKASFRPLRLVGGERAAREPWRSAAGACWACGFDLPHPPEGIEIARLGWEKGLNTHETSAVGRLFDAAACLVADVSTTSHEAQAAMALEALAGDTAGTPVDLAVHRSKDGLLTVDWAPLVPHMLDRHRSAAQRAADFHASLAAAIATLVGMLDPTGDIPNVGLTGGVFQNVRLVEETQAALRRTGREPVLHRHLPSNDASISFGQIVEYQAMLERGE